MHDGDSNYLRARSFCKGYSLHLNNCAYENGIERQVEEKALLKYPEKNTYSHSFFA